MTSFLGFVREHRVVLVVLLVALLLRLFLVPYAKFENETARDLIISTHMLDEGEWRLKGLSPEIDPEAPQQAFGPAFYYFLAFSQLLWRHPYSAVVLISFLIILSAFLFYLLLDRYYGRKVAILATTFFVFNPWVFAFVSLNFANPSFLVPFVILLYYALHRIIVDKRDGYLIVVGVALALLLQFHLSSLLLLPIVFLLLLFLRPRIFLSRWFLITLAVSFLFFVPYLVYTLQDGSFQDTYDFIFTNRYMSSRFENLRDSVGIPFMLATTYFGPYLLGQERLFSPFVHSLFFGVDLLISLVIGVQLLFLMRSFRRPLLSGGNARSLILLAWFGLPILLAILPGANVSPHYLFITYPSQFLLLGLFFTSFPLKKFFRGVLACVFISAYLVYLAGFFSFLAPDGGTSGIYGVPLGTKISVLEHVSEQYPDGYLAFYDYVKAEYAYLQPLYAPGLTLLTHRNITDGMDGYLLLDFVSYGNFAERSIPAEELEVLRSLPMSSFGPLSLIALSDYVEAQHT